MTLAFGGEWTLEKLDILGQYLDRYTTALKYQPFQLIYLDAFAGAGYWAQGSSYTGEDYEDFTDLYRGSPIIALDVQDKPFDRLIFVEKDTVRSASLLDLARGHPDRNIEVLNEDANSVIPSFCEALRTSDRAVVFLDPFATEVPWETIERIAKTEKIDCWILFPLGAVARLMPRSDEPTVLTPNPGPAGMRVFGHSHRGGRCPCPGAATRRSRSAWR